MTNKLSAKYYSGIKPIPLHAEVFLESAELRICFSKEGIRQEANWDLNGIQPDVADPANKFILRYGNKHPYEYLEFEDNNALDELRQRYPFKKWQQQAGVFAKNPLLIAGSFATGFIALCLLAYFIMLPRFSDMLSATVPVSWETQLGDNISGGMISSGNEDVAKSKLLDSFFLVLDVPTKYPIRFHFINDSVINAFAMPGGNIVIYKGLFDKINSYESLAGLMGHEFAHVEYKHSLKTIFRSLSSFILLSALFGDLTGLAGIIVENANSIQNLSYSREFETEADAHAVNLLVERKISLKGMLDLFSIFKGEEKEGQAMPKFLNTHPVTQDRIDFVKSEMNAKEKEIVHYPVLHDLFYRMK